MNFVDNLKAKSEKVEVTQGEVVKEIVGLFKDYLENGLEKYLERVIKEDDIKKRKKVLYIEFWIHHEGCSGTHFNIAGFHFRNTNVDEYSYEADYYKGIYLMDIQKEVIDECSNLLYPKLREMGFDVNVIKYEIHPRLKILQCKVEISW